MFIIVTTFSFDALSQSKHVSKWIMDNYLFDFTDNSLSIDNLPDYLYSSPNTSPTKRMYVDSDGKIRLSSFNTILYDCFGNEIKSDKLNQITDIYYFIPLPDNDDIICGICKDGTIIKIDIKDYKIVSVEYNNFVPNFTIVHNADCSGVWLIQIDGNAINRQLLTSNGIKEGYNTISDFNFNNISLKLSRNCKYYIGRNKYTNEVFFGYFDRRTASFRNVAHCSMSTMNNGVFSPDDSKIYFPIRENRIIKIVEIPIVDEKPNFESKKEIFSFSTRAPYLFEMHFGLDGRLYMIDKKEVHVLEFLNNGKYKLTKNIFTLESLITTNIYSFLADWYLDESCSGTPCPEIAKPIIKEKDY